MNPQYIFDKLREEFIQAGIPIPDHRIEERLYYMNSLSALGRCKKENDTYYIFLSRHAMADEEQIRATLAHELIHTVDGCMNHGRNFRRYGEMARKKLGIHIDSKASKEESELSGITEARKNKAKYVILCQDCGERIYRQRKSILVEHPERYRCRCGGKLKLIRAGSDH